VYYFTPGQKRKRRDREIRNIATKRESLKKKKDSEIRAREQRIVDEEAAKKFNDEQRKQKMTDASNNLVSFEEILTKCLVIDSNIWMNPDYEDFFEVLSLASTKNDYVIELAGVQFDEIVNIKKKTNYDTDDVNRRARIAINRIEKLQKNKLLNISSVSVDAHQKAYADPTIVRLITEKSKKGLNCTFISDDKELRIRVRQHLIDLATSTWNIIEIEKLLPRCKVVIEGLKQEQDF